MFRDYVISERDAQSHDIRKPDSKSDPILVQTTSQRQDVTEDDDLSTSNPLSLAAKQLSSNVVWPESDLRKSPKAQITIAHLDIIGDAFWQAHPWVLEYGKARKKAVRRFFESKQNG